MTWIDWTIISAMFVVSIPISVGIGVYIAHRKQEKFWRGKRRPQGFYGKS